MIAFVAPQGSVFGHTATVEKAPWARPIGRFWVHTCTLDHPNALAFYIRSGFEPIERQVEIAEDPRIAGILPREVAPQIPLILPS